MRNLERSIWVFIASMISWSPPWLSSAYAIENIHDEIWHYAPGGLPLAPQRTWVSGQFEADLTERDLQSGVAFSLVRTDASGHSVDMLRFAITGLDLPAAGAPVNINFTLGLSCDGTSDSFWVEPGMAIISFCHPTNGAVPVMFRDGANGERFLVDGADTFGIAVVDESGRPGAHPIASDALHCGGSLGVIQSEEQASAFFLQQKSAVPARLQEGGDSGWLGVYFDPAGTVCQGKIEPGQPGTIYILAKTRGLTACGLTGAEFRFTGLPASWTVFPVPNSGMFNLGDPFGQGVVSVFGNCQTAETTLLYTVLVFATSVEENVELGLEMRNPPTGVLTKCPVFLMCDFPMFAMICVETVPCFVNAKTARACETPLAALNSTWGGVKELYR